MNAPIGLLGAALLFWAQQTGLWIVAVPMILILEGARLTDRRWNLAREDVFRIGDLCTLLFAAFVVYLYLTRELTRAMATVLAWLPLTCFPLIAAQCLSAEGRLDLGALFWSARRRAPGSAVRSFDMSYPYFTLCVLSAGSANARTPVFYAGTFLLTSWALWKARPRARPVWAWAVLLAASGALGCVGAAGLKELQASIEKAAIGAIFGDGEVRNDPDRSRTSIGELGRVQQSGGIALRVYSDQAPPALLRAASYNRYWDGQWFARESAFQPVAAAGGTSWQLAPAAPGARSAVVLEAWPKKEGVLSLPLNAFRIEELRASALGLNPMGAVKASGVPAVVRYRVEFAPGAARDEAPVRADLDIPPQERAAFAVLARDLKLSGAKPATALAAIRDFFSKNFRYTIYLDKAGPQALRDFLFKSRAGHCEYFATATVLLLRAAGIPARYAAGWSVQEYSAFEKAYVVRQRHAHAWALAYVDGAWRDADTTPTSWSEIERGRGAFWEPLTDRLSWLGLELSLGRVWLTDTGGRGPAAWFLLAALLAWIFWKGAGVVQASRRADRESAGGVVFRGADSEFYRIEERLAGAGLGRRPWETQSGWVDRIAPDLEGPAAASLRTLLRLHARYRFDPMGITDEERGELKRGARAWVLDSAMSSSARKS